MHDASFTCGGLLRMQIGLANFCNFVLRTDEKPVNRVSTLFLVLDSIKTL